MARDADRGDAEIKDRYREALDRKRGQQADAHADSESRDQSKIHGEHGVARAQRSFRRKSG